MTQKQTYEKLEERIAELEDIVRRYRRIESRLREDSFA